MGLERLESGLLGVGLLAVSREGRVGVWDRILEGGRSDDEYI